MILLSICIFLPMIGANLESADLCSSKPSNCNQVCPFGYLKDIASRCTCTCAQNPCQYKLCGHGEVCLALGVRAQCVSNSVSGRSECPRLSGGICALRCEVDNDCDGRLICCSNGCGRECVVPLGQFPIKAKPIKPVTDSSVSFQRPLNRLITAVNELIPVNLPTRTERPVQITPIERIVRTENDFKKVGQCPTVTTVNECKARKMSCTFDTDCDNVQKCCMTSCGTKCLDPIKATACVHLSQAVERLPDGHLLDGFKPECSAVGKFLPIQCDHHECWCVDVNYGTEIPGSRIVESMRKPDMCIELRPCAHKCASTCPHGLLMDQFGCPVDNCLCRDICHAVRCLNTRDSCQLVEPDCQTPPCLPVPRCLLNPCPMGHPMTLPTGVTALCVQSEQCSKDFWCHKIGYSGLGFCCPGKPMETQAGICPNKQPIKNAVCVSTCKIDSDCSNGKCCFDGCGLSCHATMPESTKIEEEEDKDDEKEQDMNHLTAEFQPGNIAAYNKVHLSSLVADCPVLPSSTNCSKECSSDSDCAGMKRCCRAGCGTRCTYFTKSTPCFHQALTAELYSLRKQKKCDQAGNFEKLQCDDNSCFCVEEMSGDEIIGTRSNGARPNCLEPIQCEIVDCLVECPFGFETDSKGCPTCRCNNPCQQVKCPQGSMCILSSVSCYQQENCSPQPRCVLAVCPAGEALISPIGVVESCSGQRNCPSHHWCHDLGHSSGGVCCPLPHRPVRPGSCPRIEPTIDNYGACNLECRADDDCPSARKCCFDGCGTMCLEVEVPRAIKPVISNSIDAEKPGNCPQFEKRVCNIKETNNECSTDMQCTGVQKCCSDGCRKMCIYADRNTACLQLKAALQQIGQMQRVKCRPDGSYEEVQCDANFCWCVDKNGVEVEGTRTSEDISPNCKAHRRCQVPLCTREMDCKFGFEKDSNGCNTCDCRNPCEEVECPETAVCVPLPVECDGEICPEVPRCIVNPCPIGSPIVDKSTFDPLSCHDNNQCIGTSTPSYCHLFKYDEGYCCPGPEPRSNPGTCPRIIEHTGDCTRHCVLDSECKASEKCCSNGCGLFCQSAEFATPVHSIMRIGECMPVRSLGAFCSQRSSVSDCSTDSDCPPLLKCCSDGCVNRCGAPHITTHCIHAKLSAIELKEHNPALFVPECDSLGDFLQIQTHYGLRWCVDESGDEIPGTKTTKQPNCRYPRSCPVRSCTKHCPFGFKTDNDGCVVCDCRLPCELIQCAAGTVCRMVDQYCISEDCQPVVNCVPNMCSTGEPFVDEETQVMKECHERSDCPAGYGCVKRGYLGKGVCCQGTASSHSRLQCQSLPSINSSVDGSSCVVGCRHAADCPQATCCFNGCGTSCQFHTHEPVRPVHAAPSLSNTQVPIPIHPVQTFHPVEDEQEVVEASSFTTPRSTPSNSVRPHLLSTRTKLGTCPVLLLNPGCREECLTDSDCAGFLKCCKASCAALCVAPEVATVCIHLLLAYQKEARDATPPVQCTNTGYFRQYQCDNKSKQCWCVDANTGHELEGTRTLNALGFPDCSHPEICSSSCADVRAACPYGLRLDTNGCPLNGICQCRNPCEDFHCSSVLSSCALVQKQCIDGAFCPPLPKCIPNLCGLNAILKDEYDNPRLCKSNSDCKSGRCTLEGQMSQEIGMCCSIPVTTKKPPRRKEQKTQCLMLRLAIDRLYNTGAIVGLSRPSCSTSSGLFDEIQCDSDRTCWCVNRNTGQEIEGTRRVKSLDQPVCSVRLKCPLECNEDVCPFGLKLDRSGCPEHGCLCSSPCDLIQCPSGTICLMSKSNCRHGKCFGVPICEASPCPDSRSPAFDNLTREQITCDHQTNKCPSRHFCVDTKHGGVCCPHKDSKKVPSKSKAGECAHGDPFAGSSDGTPLVCTIQNNGCPSTHYCSTQAGQLKGICCVSKRYVCNQSGDRGPCSIAVPRYFYSSVNQSCTLFDYGGCAGNLNNFATLDDCQAFCEGVGLDINSPFLLDDSPDIPKEIYELGFSLTGPMVEKEKRSSIERELLAHLLKNFSISSISLHDLHIREDNTVRFLIEDSDAREHARAISEAVSTGGLSFETNNMKFVAEPQTLFAHLMAQPSPEVETAKIVFWTAVFAAAVFAGFIVLGLCVTCILFCREKDKITKSIRGSTPSNFVSHSIVGQRQPQLQRRREMIFSREDLHSDNLSSDPRNSIQYSHQNDRPQSSIYY